MTKINITIILENNTVKLQALFVTHMRPFGLLVIFTTRTRSIKTSKVSMLVCNTIMQIADIVLAIDHARE